MNPSTDILTVKGNFYAELFYVLGALLGDGCAYKWSGSKYTQLIVIGDEKFCKKYATKLSVCTGKKVNAFLNRSKGVWRHSFRNDEICKYFIQVREKPQRIQELFKRGDCRKNQLAFVEGFFDAEGCIKIIQEKQRKTPKVCLDICNTHFELIEEVRKALYGSLRIHGRYSNQKAYTGPDGHPRKKSYHLRIYQKSAMKHFLSNIHTTKLYEKKYSVVQHWLSMKNCHPFRENEPVAEFSERPRHSDG